MAEDQRTGRSSHRRHSAQRNAEASDSSQKIYVDPLAYCPMGLRPDTLTASPQGSLATARQEVESRVSREYRKGKDSWESLCLLDVRISSRTSNG